MVKRTGHYDTNQMKNNFGNYLQDIEFAPWVQFIHFSFNRDTSYLSKFHRTMSLNVCDYHITNKHIVKRHIKKNTIKINFHQVLSCPKLVKISSDFW